MAFPAMATDVEALVQWSRRTELATPVSGVVASVAVNAGERAAKGQLLLALDDAPFRAAVQEAEALRARLYIGRLGREYHEKGEQTEPDGQAFHRAGSCEEG